MCNSNYSFYFPFVLISVDNNITRCHQDCHDRRGCNITRCQSDCHDRHGLHFFYYHSCSISIIIYCEEETLAVVLFLKTQP